MLQVTIRRGDFIESTHQVHAHVVSADGHVLYDSENDFHFYPRSAIKPLQTLLLLKSGAYRARGLDLRHLAIASASHAGGLEHTQLVTSWLQQLGLTAAALRCGSQWPSDEVGINELRCNSKTPSAIHNNCSGKHTGFLTSCVHLNLPIENYHEFQHPLQQMLKELLENIMLCDLKDYGIDGCSIPTYQVSFQKMAMAFAKMAEKAVTNPDSDEALIVQAFKAHPVLTSGQGEYCTQLMINNNGRVLAKVGAEGVLVGIIPEKKLSILVKCVDGSQRGAQNAFDFLIQKYANLKPELPSQIKNWVGTHVGDVQVVDLSDVKNL
ncbi:MAG: asparaginase [Bdellovibrionaceae bacterium]|nr:asparaginase [Bdellovibrio sp.]